MEAITTKSLVPVNEVASEALHAGSNLHVREGISLSATSVQTRAQFSRCVAWLERQRTLLPHVKTSLRLMAGDGQRDLAASDGVELGLTLAELEGNSWESTRRSLAKRLALASMYLPTPTLGDLTKNVPAMAALSVLQSLRVQEALKGSPAEPRELDLGRHQVLRDATDALGSRLYEFLRALVTRAETVPEFTEVTAALQKTVDARRAFLQSAPNLADCSELNGIPLTASNAEAHRIFVERIWPQCELLLQRDVDQTAQASLYKGTQAEAGDFSHVESAPLGRKIISAIKHSWERLKAWWRSSRRRQHQDPRVTFDAKANLPQDPSSACSTNKIDGGNSSCDVHDPGKRAEGLAQAEFSRAPASANHSTSRPAAHEVALRSRGHAQSKSVAVGVDPNGARLDSLPGKSGVGSALQSLGAKNSPAAVSGQTLGIQWLALSAAEQGRLRGKAEGALVELLDALVHPHLKRARESQDQVLGVGPVFMLAAGAADSVVPVALNPDLELYRVYAKAERLSIEHCKRLLSEQLRLWEERKQQVGYRAGTSLDGRTYLREQARGVPMYASEAYRQVTQASEHSHAFYFVIDLSYSTRGEAAKQIVRASVILNEVFESLPELKIGGLGFHHEILELRDLHEALSDTVRANVGGMIRQVEYGKATNLGWALSEGSKRLDQCDARFKTLVVITDALDQPSPKFSGPHYQPSGVLETIRTTTTQRVVVLGLGVDPQPFATNFPGIQPILCDDAAKLPEHFVQLVGDQLDFSLSEVAV